jgi:peroxiredoxin
MTKRGLGRLAIGGLLLAACSAREDSTTVPGEPVATAPEGGEELAGVEGDEEAAEAEAEAEAEVEVPWADEVAIRVADQPPAYPPNDEDDPLAITDPAYGSNDDAPRAPKIGDTFPDFELPAVRGGMYELESERHAGPVMIVFYLGHWCPPCNKQLSDIQAIYDDIRFREMSVVAISADPRDDSTNWIKEQQFTFPMAVDVELNFIKRVRLEHPERAVAIHAIYMIDQKGKIFYAKVGGRRPTPQELLDAIDYHKGNWPPKS